jgi:hypothetical protein
VFPLSAPLTQVADCCTLNASSLVIPGPKAALIITYAKKFLLKDRSLIEKFKTVPFIKSPETQNGKTLWSNADIRIDFGFNTPGSKEIWINWQKNKGSKLDGLKKLSTDHKIFTQAITAGEALSEQEIAEQIVAGFQLSGQ